MFRLDVGGCDYDLDVVSIKACKTGQSEMDNRIECRVPECSI